MEERRDDGKKEGDRGREKRRDDVREEKHFGGSAPLPRLKGRRPQAGMRGLIEKCVCVESVCAYCTSVVCMCV